MPNLEAQLLKGLDELQITVTQYQVEQLLSYIFLIDKWNKAYNLTAIRDINQMLVKHLFDSIAINPHLKNESLLDIGSGAGLPSIPLAILNPKIEITSVDSNGKKTRFQQQVKAELKLGNLEVTQERIENLATRKFTQITSRAFASLKDMVTLSANLLDEHGAFLAMKGRFPEDELSELPAEYKLIESVNLSVPDLHQMRYLLKIGRS